VVDDVGPLGPGTVVGIYLTGAGGRPMRAAPSARAVPGEGLVGDRYQLGTGKWSRDRRLWSEVTLVAAEALEAAEREHGVRLSEGASRRNLVTRGVDLAALIGRRFLVGEVELVGDRECAPCRYLDRVTGQPAMGALAGHAVTTAGPLDGT
jgi:hypothetical protein